MVNHKNLLLVLFFHFELASSSPSNPNATLTSPFLCHPHQSHALLQFKSEFMINKSSSEGCVGSYPKTESWKEGTDCCSSWDGVTCDAVTGHVIELNLSCSHLQGTIHSNSSLFSPRFAPYLRRLNLAENDFFGSSMSSEFGVKFGSSLTYLNLFNSNFSGNVPSEISLLSNLVLLSLSFNSRLRVESDRVVQRMAQNLTHLMVLNLDRVNMSLLHDSFLMNLSSRLTWLTLRDCQLQGQFPASFLLRPNLLMLDLSGNNLGSITSLPDFNSTTPNSSNLQILDISDSNISTSASNRFLDLVGNHRSLRFFDLSGNQISSPIPISLCNMTQLFHLGLGDNLLTGPLPSCLFDFPSLRYLSLSDNKLHGQIPISFCNMTRLYYLRLANNRLTGSLPSCLFGLPSLEYLFLGGNKLHGQIPTSLFKSPNLVTLELSSNNFSGSLDFDLFLELKKLQAIVLADNKLSLSTSSTYNHTLSLPNIRYVSLSSCNLSQFPNFFRALRNLIILEISNNKIHGPIPEWMFDVGKYTMYGVDFSRNFLTSVGEIQWENIQVINIESNLLQGPIPIPSISTRFFLVSKNNLSGEIPSLICNLSSLEVLDLSHNQLVGMIPQCVGNMSRLSVLNLGTNKLQGIIPDTFAKGNNMNYLVLNENQLRGRLPQTLSYCQYLTVFDVGNNMIEDTFPRWLDILSALEVLVLRSNKLFGLIDGIESPFFFPKLRILDVSDNKLVGQLPTKMIGNLMAMMDKHGSVGYDQLYMEASNAGFGSNGYSMIITVKGFEMEYVKILTTLATIDLSRNKFEGHIPEVIGKLISLKGLNLSRNLLTGHIPSPMRNLGSLEWLDLSHNELSGQIPRELTDLNFLQVLNLSSNQLYGAVPQGKQFNTFGNDSYKDNLALCGFPLTKVCGPNHERPTMTSEDKSSSDSEGGFSWEGAFTGYGCGIVFGLSMGYVVFKKTRSLEWLVRLVERKKQQGRVGKRSKRHVKTTLFMYR